jgi:UDP-N-acetylmuramate dehydrogenase
MASWRRIIKENLVPYLSKRTLVKYNELLARYTSFHIGGKAECLIIANTINDIKNIIKVCREYNVPLYILGAGSNLLISDQGLEGIVLKLGKAFSYIFDITNQFEANYRRNCRYLMVGAATKLIHIIRFCKSLSLLGPEFLWGIPASFGGAVKTNAGAFNHHIGELIVSITGIDNKGQELLLKKGNLQFDYRKTNIPNDFIITSGILKTHKTSHSKITATISIYKNMRKNTQPKGFSAGSVFKNPKVIPAGKLIDNVGLKGFSYGYAVISEKHANFIINQGQASMITIYEIIQKIKSLVEKNSGLILEEEIEILPKVKEVKKWQEQKKLLG